MRCQLKEMCVASGRRCALKVSIPVYSVYSSRKLEVKYRLYFNIYVITQSNGTCRIHVFTRA